LKAEKRKGKKYKNKEKQELHSKIRIKIEDYLNK